MIKINKKSWHYKLVKFGTNYDISNNLCIYFWQLVRRFIFELLFIAIIMLFTGTFMYVLAAPFMSLFLEESIFASILCVVYGVVIMKLAIEFISEDHWLATDVFAKLKSKEREKEREPSIVKKYLKSKKDKICPTLTFE